MKKALILSVLFCIFSFSFTAKATHYAGGEIYYEYIGDSTGTPYHYEVTLVLFRRAAGSGFYGTAGVYIESHCGNGSFSLDRFIPNGMDSLASNGVRIPSYTSCLDTAQAYEELEAHFYKGDVILPGACVYTLSFRASNRPLNISNLVNPSSQSLYIHAELDNTLGPNSSPVPLTTGAKSFCINQPSIWNHPAIEPDGDSIRYVLAQPLDDQNMPIPWAAGYSTTQPIATQNGVSFNENTGLMQFTPSQVELGIVKIRIEEYRFDTISPVPNWRMIGTTTRDAIFLVTNSCNSQLLNPEFEITNAIPHGGDSLSEISCKAKSLQVESSRPLYCSSINVADFALYSEQSGFLQPIVSVGTNCTTELTTNLISLTLKDSLYYNDTLTLMLKPGMDSSTVITSCGLEAAADTIAQFYVDCGTGLRIDNSDLNSFSVFPNPAGDVLKVSFKNGSADRRIQIIDLRGNILRESEASGILEQQDISELPAGIYLIRNTEDYSTEKFQKL